MDQRSRDGRFIGGIQILAMNSWKEFSKFRDVGCKNCFCFEKDHPKFSLQEEGQSRGAEGPERRPVPAMKTDRLHDPRLLSSYWRS